jgi:hypothetical protein
MGWTCEESWFYLIRMEVIFFFSRKVYICSGVNPFTYSRGIPVSPRIERPGREADYSFYVAAR